ncbi:MAG: hypothetical protein L0H79_10645 [Intrasporangium sp.]|uniref:hypothetical protein n=1 Tax=Intrasporangium sp. TaxID=1925024 RepID=UPI0026498B2D|nr:hypothetical protein [Intrasporangium sp.]MDN5796192.1 hypothetical protein [Intrasporangium sp.]
MGWVTFGPALQAATGSFAIGHPGDRYSSTILPGACFTTPSPTGVVILTACPMQQQDGGYTASCVPATAKVLGTRPYSGS